ncbi:hypothetical protein [Chryseosolibacter indicus]|uniref:Tetratricopeptide repeat protein n=1 Tax=Chryseosolibacter indicus TaxID=2782351 RepID=A0ABS5VW39_9BACT|nr:hypothetical protein [Chryseosolibacter indicus]MBT1705089.1 hypothetical protein [Chryseosolibacter indicus]
MKKYVVLVTFFTLTIFTLCAQDYTFKVLVNKGKNEVKAGSAWQPLKTGSILKLKDEVKLADNAYLGLIHSSGKPLELKQAGNYKVSDLSAKVGSGTSVVNKYTEFILSSNTQKNNRLSATGAVHRGSNTTRVYLPKSEAATVYGDRVIVDWESIANAKSYVIIIKSLFGDELLKTESIVDELILDLSDSKFKKEVNILVEVFPKDKPEMRPEPAYMIKRLPAAEKQRITLLMKDIAILTTETSALNQLILAGFFEQNKLFIDAANAYHKAIELAPDVQQYKDDYNNFLIRNGMKDEKKDK